MSSEETLYYAKLLGDNAASTDGENLHLTVDGGMSHFRCTHEQLKQIEKCIKEFFEQEERIETNRRVFVNGEEIDKLEADAKGLSITEVTSSWTSPDKSVKSEPDSFTSDSAPSSPFVPYDGGAGSLTQDAKIPFDEKYGNPNVGF